MNATAPLPSASQPPSVLADLRDAAPELYALADVELDASLLETVEVERDSQLRRGWLLLIAEERAGDAPKQRTQAVRDRCAAAGITHGCGKAALRVARLVGPSLYAEFQALEWSHFLNAVERSGAGAVPESVRAERVRHYLRVAADEGLSPSQLRARMKADLDPTQEMAPSDGALPAAPETDALEPSVALFPGDLVTELLSGLRRSLQRDEPGTWPEIEAVTLAHVRERYNALVAAGWCVMKGGGA